MEIVTSEARHLTRLGVDELAHAFHRRLAVDELAVFVR